jgi:hypothetical protein
MMEEFDLVATTKEEAKDCMTLDDVVVLKLDTTTLQLSKWNDDSKEWEVIE